MCTFSLCFQTYGCKQREHWGSGTSVGEHSLNRLAFQLSDSNWLKSEKKMIILTAFDMSLAQKLFLFEVSDVYQIFNEAYGIFWCDIHYWHEMGTSTLLNKFPIVLLCNKGLLPPASAKGQPTFVILIRARGIWKGWQITDFCPTWSCCQHTGVGGRWRSYRGRRKDAVFYVMPYFSYF